MTAGRELQTQSPFGHVELVARSLVFQPKLGAASVNDLGRV